ncbi:MAG: (Fe-S)-binding protein [Archaeoglobus sp.]|nr:(Fe-S)-binding protein [Archaeoglobus sp.]
MVSLYKPRIIADFVRESIKKTGNPLGVQSSKLTTWHEGLKLSERSKRLLFTGLLYQLSPYTVRITEILSRFEESKVEKLVERLIQSKTLRVISSLAPILKVPKEEKEYYNGIIRKIAQILLKQKVDFGYNPGLDLYSGILFYEIGDEEGFAEHASRVVRILKEKGVEEVITIDPHTTYAFKVLYPEYTDSEIEVRTYFELLDDGIEYGKIKPLSDVESVAPVTLHDPCYYGRYLELSNVPRKILTSLGIEVIDVRNSGKLTSCCGGPVESFSPNLSETMAKYRAEELKGKGCMVTMCPICLSNFKRVRAPFIDFAELLGGLYV